MIVLNLLIITVTIILIILVAILIYKYFKDEIDSDFGLTMCMIGACIVIIGITFGIRGIV